ncbi:MAG: XRE family transcriptional regulator [Gemmatimonadales bacterium]|nr:MAG: XRE family transcriptional regulator [Gemmatimonadales bacterium]
MNAKEFGNRLAEALDGMGMSKLQFARELRTRREARKEKGEPLLRKVDRPALYAFLQGRDLPPVDTLGEMADVLRVRLGWLAEGEEPVERDLPEYPPPIWVVDGHRGPWRRPDVIRRMEARTAFEVVFGGRSEGFEEADPTVRLIFQLLLARRLARRRNRGDRGPADAVYRADTARNLYLKCFLDVMAELPSETTYASPEFTDAFLGRVARWLADEQE